jgi:hypothetical protein
MWLFRTVKLSNFQSERATLRARSSIKLCWSSAFCTKFPQALPRYEDVDCSVKFDAKSLRQSGA